MVPLGGNIEGTCSWCMGPGGGPVGNPPDPSNPFVTGQAGSECLLVFQRGVLRFFVCWSQAEGVAGTATLV